MEDKVLESNQDNNEVIISMTVDDIKKCVFIVQGKSIMLDCDLAMFYGYSVKALNQQVKRNIKRFPDDFMFRTSKEDIALIKDQIKSQSNQGIVPRSQFVTLYGDETKGKNIKYNPYVFTEQGIYMLAAVLKGDLAIEQSIYIMRAFKEMRHFIRRNQQFITGAEMNLLNARVTEISMQVAGLNDHKIKTDQNIESIQKSIECLNENFVLKDDYINFIIYKGQKFEADAAYIDIYQRAKKSIYIVDNYVNTKTLQLLSQKKTGVNVIIFTENGFGRQGFLTTAVVTDFNKQYPTLSAKHNQDCHDRLIVLDYGLKSEQVFHCGASSMDAGKKLCAINSISDTSLIHPVIDKMLLGADYTI